MSSQHKAGNHRSHRRVIIGVAITAAALLVAGTGGVVAHGMITSGEIKDGTIKSRDVHDGAIGTKKLTNGGTKKADLSQWVQDQLQKPGPKGDPGEPGQDGADGQDGVAGYEVHNREVRWSDGVPGETMVPCPDGKVALGGGHVVESIRGGTATVTESQPVYDAATGSAIGWVVRGSGTGEANVKAWVTCAQVAG